MVVPCLFSVAAVVFSFSFGGCFASTTHNKPCRFVSNVRCEYRTCARVPELLLFASRRHDALRVFSIATSHFSCCWNIRAAVICVASTGCATSHFSCRIFIFHFYHQQRDTISVTRTSIPSTRNSNNDNDNDNDNNSSSSSKESTTTMTTTENNNSKDNIEELSSTPNNNKLNLHQPTPTQPVSRGQEQTPVDHSKIRFDDASNKYYDDEYGLQYKKDKRNDFRSVARVASKYQYTPTSRSAADTPHSASPDHAKHPWESAVHLKTMHNLRQSKDNTKLNESTAYGTMQTGSLSSQELANLVHTVNRDFSLEYAAGNADDDAADDDDDDGSEKGSKTDGTGGSADDDDDDSKTDDERKARGKGLFGGNSSDEAEEEKKEEEEDEPEPEPFDFVISSKAYAQLMATATYEQVDKQYYKEDDEFGNPVLKFDGKLVLQTSTYADVLNMRRYVHYLQTGSASIRAGNKQRVAGDKNTHFVHVMQEEFYIHNAKAVASSVQFFSKGSAEFRALGDRYKLEQSLKARVGGQSGIDQVAPRGDSPTQNPNSTHIPGSAPKMSHQGQATNAGTTVIPASAGTSSKSKPPSGTSERKSSKSRSARTSTSARKSPASSTRKEPETCPATCVAAPYKGLKGRMTDNGDVYFVLEDEEKTSMSNKKDGNV